MHIKNVLGEMNPYARKKIQGQEQVRETARQANTRSASENADKVVLSSEARLRGTALRTANEAPDVRQRKVDRLKTMVREGTYQPDIKKAAANLVRDDLDLLK